MNKIININKKIYDRLLKAVVDFNQDLDYMKNTLIKINNWTNNGLTSLDTCILPLTNQINEWEEKMDNALLLFKDNIIELKNIDDRINNTVSVDINDSPNDTYIEKWDHYYSIYKKMYDNLKDDINILNNVTNSISNYNNLGVELGDALNKIKEQKSYLESNINKSTEKCENLVILLEKEASKINIS